MLSYRNINLSKIITRTVLLFSIILIVLLIIFLRQSYNFYTFIIPIVVALLSSIFYIIYEHNNIKMVFTSYNNLKIFKLLLYLYTLIFFITSVILFTNYFYNIRSIYPQIFLSILSIVLFSEIIISPIKKLYIYIIIIQLIILSFVINYYQIFQYESIIGVDPWFHQMFVKQITELGIIPNNYSYSFQPIFHLIITSFYLLTKLDYKFSIFYSINLSDIIINVLFIYLIGKKLYNYKIGCLSSFFMIISNHYINEILFPIPNTLAYMFIIIILYIIMLGIENKYIITLILMISLILTHPLGAFSLLIIMNIILILLKITDGTKKLSFSTNIFILFLIGTFSYWTYVSLAIKSIASLLRWFLDIGRSEQDIITVYTFQPPIIEQVINISGQNIFYFFALLGYYYIISKKTNNKSFIFSTIGIIILGIAYIPIIIQFPSIPHRWIYLSQILLCIPASIAIYFILNYFKNKKIILITLSSLIMVLSFLMLISIPANINHQIFMPNTGNRLAFNRSELQSIKTTSIFNKYIIYGDWYSGDPIIYLFNENFITITDESFIMGSYNNLTNKTLLIRDEICINIFRGEKNLIKLNRNPVNDLDRQLFNCIYSSNSVKTFILERVS